MQFTSKGQPYIFAPHTRRIIHFFSSHDEIETRFGPGIRRLFNFFILVIGINFLLATFAFIGWLMCIASENTSTSNFQWAQFFVSSYQQGPCDGYWAGFSIVQFTLWWIIGIIYFIWERYIFEPLEANLNYNWSDVITKNRDQPRFYWFSACVMITALAISTCIFYALLNAQKYVSLTYGEATFLNIRLISLMGIPVALSFAICNFIWDHMSLYCTQVENNHTWFHFRISHATKLISFKVIAGTILFYLTSFVFQDDSVCFLQESGVNLFLNICIDIFVITLLLQNIAPILIRRLQIKCFGRSEDDVNLKPVFDMSEEILGLLYRQFLLHLALMVVPIVGFIGIIGTILQYSLVKFRMLYVCQPTQYIQEDLRWFIFTMCSFIALASTLSYPNGIMWMLFSPNIMPAGFQNCSVFGALQRL